MSLLFGLPRAYAKAQTNDTPSELGVIQDVSMEMSREIKELYGQMAFPVALAKGKGKCGGSLTVARFNSFLFEIALSSIATTGGTIVTKEDGEIPDSTAYEITVDKASDFAADWGVILVGATEHENVQMKKVASNPTAGQYSVDTATGKYTFNVADKGKAVIIGYEYDSDDTQETIEVSNELMGVMDTVELKLAYVYNNKNTLYTFPNVAISNFKVSPKQDDFATASFDFSAAADGAGKVIRISSGK